MTKVPARQNMIARAIDAWVRAEMHWERGRLRSAFRLMLAAAKMGESGAQITVGYMYDNAVGVRPDKQAALYWYKRAYRGGEACAAHNIGTVWRDNGNFVRARYWFERAIQMNGGDDGEANYEIAKLHLGRDGDASKAVPFLNKVCKSKNVTPDCREQARRLLKRTMQKSRTASKGRPRS
jgi:TPR repeat protein